MIISLYFEFTVILYKNVAVFFPSRFLLFFSFDELFFAIVPAGATEPLRDNYKYFKF
jgi:hypothetical protein